MSNGDTATIARPQVSPTWDRSTGLIHQRWLAVGTLVATDLFLLSVLSDLYGLVVRHALGDAPGALAHGESVLALEHAWGIGIEGTWYSALSARTALLGAALLYYTYSIYLAPAVVAILLVVRDVRRYRSMRTVFVTTTLLAYGVFWLYPMSPPCLVPDTAMACETASPPDPFAAMPSLHVAWACVAAVGLASLSTKVWAQALGVVHVGLTFAVVLATGHHFVLDGLSGLVLVLVVLAVARLVERRLDRRRGCVRVERTPRRAIDDRLEPCP